MSDLIYFKEKTRLKGYHFDKMELKNAISIINRTECERSFTIRSIDDNARIIIRGNRNKHLYWVYKDKKITIPLDDIETNYIIKEIGGID